uniref:Protein PRRC2B-like n=1 Tax=Callorhinchus milii TaxID=7868 RepID=A0A4W3GYJ7_CALMI
MSLPLHTPLQTQGQISALSLRQGTPVSQPQDMFNSLQPFRSQQLYLQPGLSPPSAPVISGGPVKGQYLGFSAMQASDLAKAQSGLPYQQSPCTPPLSLIYNTQHGGSQLLEPQLIPVTIA